MSRNELMGTSKAQVIANRTTTGRFRRSASPSVIKPVVSARRQTAAEVRQYSAALDLLLQEMIRQELQRGEEKRHE